VEFESKDFNFRGICKWSTCRVVKVKQLKWAWNGGRKRVWK